MARRIKSRKRKHLANRTYGGGNTKNRRGKGNRGGVGRAGFHKHNWLRTIKFEGTTQAQRGDKGFRNPTTRKLKEMGLNALERKIHSEKIAPAANGVYSLSLPGVKVLSDGSVTLKLDAKAGAFSKKAAEKIKNAGGSVSTF